MNALGTDEWNHEYVNLVLFGLRNGIKVGVGHLVSAHCAAFLLIMNDQENEDELTKLDREIVSAFDTEWEKLTRQIANPN
jgi:hypothetical protein